MHTISQTSFVDKRGKKLSPGRVRHHGRLFDISEQAISVTCVLVSIVNASRRWLPEIKFVGSPSLSAIMSVSTKCLR